MIQKLLFPVDAAEAGGKFGAVSRTGGGIVPLFLDAFEIIDDFDFDILEVIDYFDLHVLEVLDQFDSAARVLEVLDDLDIRVFEAVHYFDFDVLKVLDDFHFPVEMVCLAVLGDGAVVLIDGHLLFRHCTCCHYDCS